MSTEDFASFIQHQEEFRRVASPNDQAIWGLAGALFAAGALYFDIGWYPPLLGLAALIGGIIVPFVYYSYYWVRYTRDNCPRCGRQVYTQLVGNAKVGSFWSFSRHTNREGDDRYYICHACRWYFLIEGVNDLG